MISQLGLRGGGHYVWRGRADKPPHGLCKMCLLLVSVIWSWGPEPSTPRRKYLEVPSKFIYCLEAHISTQLVVVQ